MKTNVGHYFNYTFQEIIYFYFDLRVYKLRVLIRMIRRL